MFAVFLMRHIAEKHARELLLTGKDHRAAAEARRIGLITQICRLWN